MISARSLPGLLAVASVAAFAASSPACTSPSSLGPPPPCYVGDPCDSTGVKPISGGGAGGVGGAGGAGGAGSGGAVAGGTGGTGVVSGSIYRLEEDTFAVTSAYAGSDVNVVYDDAMAVSQTVPVLNGTFTLPNAAPTKQWLLADVTTLAIQAWDTYSFQDLSAGAVELPIVGTAPLEAIGLTLAPPINQIDPARMHLVIHVGVPGISLTGPNFVGATIAYDVAPGQYTTGAAATGSAVILVLNSFVPGGDINLALTDQNGLTTSVLGVKGKAGVVTYVDAAQ